MSDQLERAATGAAPTKPSVNPGRREMLGTMARWTVPTVLTMTLGARVLEAKASCPPCQKKVGTVCRSCTISQMLNCTCEPCLGPPYCTAVGPTPMQPTAPGQIQAPGSQPILRDAPGSGTGGLTPYQQMLRDRARAARDPFRQPTYDDPFGARKNDIRNPTGLYDRLRPDTSLRRQP
jgi:hypothetical protein